ncbi:MAG: putative dienelactone hydrolase, partial [Myxococcota bacterium]
MLVVGRYSRATLREEDAMWTMTTTLLWLLGCSGGKDSAVGEDPSEEGVDWQALDPGAPGPFNVGHVTIEHTYTAFEGDEPRTIPIDVWYPTEDTSGEDAIHLYGTDALSFEDAVPAAPIHDGGYPIHLYSHGWQGWGATSSFLMRHFASHGWVAVAPNHVGNLLADHEDPLYTAHYIHKLRDLQESLDVVAALALAGPKQADAVVLSGHSFGASYGAWGGGGARSDAIEETCASGGLGSPCTEQEVAV